MGAVHIALYAEGARELMGAGGWPTAPGDVLQADELGAAHRLLARIVAAQTNLPDGAIRFLSPIRDRRGRQLRGSLLHGGDHLRRALLAHELVGKTNDGRPSADAFVVLVDADGDASRHTSIVEGLAGVVVPKVVGVAVQEFETWLIADLPALNDVLGTQVDDPGPRESLPPGGAKAFLLDRLQGQREQDVRLTLAERVDIEVVRQVCPSFDRFVKDLCDTLLAL
ncbi:MAG: DUF4276 family protein [Deltaproteobacteria bacterium]